MSLNEYLRAFEALPEHDRAAVISNAQQVVGDAAFIPNPGPQTDAYFSEADELFYGGAAGGGKSALVCGLAVDEYSPALILRREATQIKSLEAELERILGSRDGYNSQSHIWRLPGKDAIELGGVPHEKDKEKYQGRAHRLKAFDEITQFTESQYRYIIGWLRDARGGRCRVIATGNPPTNAEGQWVVRYWAPWLDKAHPNPAMPGELRWFTTISGEDVEVDGRGPHMVDGVEVFARSRTFIPSRLEDNPDLMASGYAATLEGMPDELRQRLRFGSFDVVANDKPFQVIPTQWILDAQERWTPEPPEHAPMSALAVDIAQGGSDNTTLAARYDAWFAEVKSFPGSETPTGNEVAGLIVAERRNGCIIMLDMGGGYGGATKMRLADNGIEAKSFKGAETSGRRTVDKQFGFYNNRAEALWRLREALDPAQDGGSAIMLPPDPEMVSDLTAAVYEITSRGIKVTPKEKVVEMLGRSPDKGDSVMMANFAGPKLKTHGNQWREYSSANSGRSAVKVNLGRDAARRRR